MDEIIEKILALKQTCGGSQMVEVHLQVEAYNDALDDVIKVITEKKQKEIL